MPDRLRAAFSPARLGGYLANGPLWLIYIAVIYFVECFFYHLFFGFYNYGV